MLGTDTSQISAQITNIEHDGFWMLTPDGEYFVAFEDYPTSGTQPSHRFIISGSRSMDSTGRTWMWTLNWTP
jgi:hypothetical protein